MLAPPNLSANPNGGDLQLKQGIAASLELQPNQSPASSSSSRVLGPLDDCHPPCTPPQLASDAHAAQQACRAAPDPALPSAESAQPKVLTTSVGAHSSRSQESTLDAASSPTGAGTGHQVGSLEASNAPGPLPFFPPCLSVHTARRLVGADSLLVLTSHVNIAFCTFYKSVKLLMLLTL